jgi:hypothetical protein
MTMRDTRFIFVEGIMGAGKSTTAEFITDQLQHNGISAQFMFEGPTIVEPHHPLRVATDLPHPNAAWLDVTVDGFIARSMDKWHAYAREAEESGTVTVCHGLLFHGNMTDLLLMDATPAVLRDYVDGVIGSIAALQPVVIYFNHADIARALRTVCDARGPAWESYQVGWKVGSPHGVRRSLKGFDGLVRLYHDYCSLCDDMFARLALPKLAIRNDGEWPAYYRTILTFLELPMDSGASSASN